MGYDEQNNIKPMSDIKERIFGAVTVMSDQDAAALWEMIVVNFSDWDHDFSKVTPAEKNAIEAAEKELQNGEFYSHDEAWS